MEQRKQKGIQNSSSEKAKGFKFIPFHSTSQATLLILICPVYTFRSLTFSSPATVMKCPLKSWIVNLISVFSIGREPLVSFFNSYYLECTYSVGYSVPKTQYLYSHLQSCKKARYVHKMEEQKYGTFPHLGSKFKCIQAVHWVGSPGGEPYGRTSFSCS